MKHEGISRQYYRKNGVFYDGWEYSIISDDYFAAKDSYHQVSSQRAEYNVEEVIDIISSILIEDDINLGTSMSNTFSWDSLNHMSIITELSKKFNIRIPPIKAYHATSVNRIMKMIQEL
jgi:acyl carrier protein